MHDDDARCLRWRAKAWRMAVRTETTSAPASFQEAQDVPEEAANWVSFTDLARGQGDDVICGMTHYGNELIVGFDPQTSSFTELGFSEVAERYDVKIHRGMTRGADGKLYFGVASLTDIPDCDRSPGGRLFRYDLVSGQYQALGRPVPQTYIQGICLDETRGRVYGNTYPIITFFDFDLRSGRTTTVHVNNIPEAPPCVDPDGLVWSMYGRDYGRRQLLGRYDPDGRRMEWLEIEFPGNTAKRSVFAASAFLWRARLYFGCTDGRLYGFDHHRHTFEDCGAPQSDASRIAYLAEGPNGLLWGVGGRTGDYHLFRFDGSRFRDYGRIEDDEGHVIHIAHVVLFHGGKVYVGETDNDDRAGLLWEADCPE